MPSHVTDDRSTQARLPSRASRAFLGQPSRALLQSIVSSMSEAVYVRGANHELLYINPAAERLTGWSLEETPSRKCYEIFGDAGQACRDRCPIDRAERERKALHHLEGELVARDKKVHPLEVSVSPIFEDGEAVASVVVLRDIEDLRALEETRLKSLMALEDAHRTLQSSEERATDFASMSSDWFWETDADHRFVFMSANPATDTRDVIGKRREEFLDVESEPEIWRNFFQTLEQKLPFKNFVYFRTDLEGEQIWISITGKPLFDRSRTFVGYRGIARNVTPEMAEQTKLRTEAQVDELTGLTNRRGFHANLQAILNNRRGRNDPFAMVFLDLDGFKEVNDTWGHQAGDAVLAEVASRISGKLRAGDIVARLGGDEFAVLLPEMRSPEDSVVIVTKLLDVIHQPIAWQDDAPLSVGASIGVAIYPGDGDDALSLVEAADRAMYAVKRSGKNAIKMASEVPD